jgi:hypothetical protein
MSRLPSGWIPERPLKEDITNMQVDVLSARCAADRLRLKCAISRVAQATSAESLETMLDNLNSVLRFVVDIGKAKGDGAGHSSQP